MRSVTRNARGRSPLVRCRPSSEVKALRTLLEHHEALSKENAALREQVQRKTDNTERVESLKRDMLAKEEETSAVKRELALSEEKIDGLTRQIADTIAEHQMTEERLRLRIRLLLQQFGQHLEQSIAPQRSTLSSQQPPPATELPPTLPTLEAEPSAASGPLPCDDAATDEYTSSSSSGSSESDGEAQGPTVPAASDI